MKNALYIFNHTQFAQLRDKPADWFDLIYFAQHNDGAINKQVCNIPTIK